jgi:quinol-cytochrome oxidoreductase complex cytochrome b subunit
VSIGWKKYLKPFLYKELPPKTGWTATLGTLCALLFGVMAASGLVLAMYYNPSPDKAYQSIDYIMKDVPMGAVLRGIHHWCAGAMVLAVFVHMLANFFSGAFKAPRQWTWIAGGCLFLVTLGLGFTGYLLPWDMKAYWATVVSTNIPKDIPLIGGAITRIVRGGETVSGLTLTRFYAIHMLLLPALLLGFTVFHIYLVRIHGLAAPPEAEPRPAGSRPYRFYPEHTLRGALVFVAIFVAIIALAFLCTPPREAIAGTLIESYLPRPEWYFMWLFQLLTYFSGPWESVGSLAVPALGVTLLFAVPFLGKTRQRPLAMGVGVTCVAAIVYLSLMGFEGARPYGQVIVVPDRPLTASEARGLHLFADRECAYCHQISGKGGHRTGPDLANIVAKGRTRDYLARFIRNPQLVSTTSIMPKYDLPQSDLQGLANFVLALDFDKYPAKVINREEILKHE